MGALSLLPDASSQHPGLQWQCLPWATPLGVDAGKRTWVIGEVAGQLVSRDGAKPLSCTLE